MNEIVVELKTKVMTNNFLSREEHLETCNTLLKYVLEENNNDDIAFAYLALASYYANIAHDTNELNYYMKKAKTVLSMEPSENLIMYYTLKALNDGTTFDLLGRLDSYLEIIRIAGILGIESRAYFAYGNIAELFRLCQDYETALDYSIGTYEKYKSYTEDYTNNKVITLTNIVELLNYIGKIDDVPFYIEEIEKLNWNSKVYPILLNICYLRLYSMSNDSDKSIKLNNNLLNILSDFSSSKSFKYDCLAIMVDAMMHVCAYDEVNKLIVYMEELFKCDDKSEWMQIQKLKIEYYEKTHNDEALKYQYLKFLKAYEIVESENNLTKIAGIRAHIEIQNIIKSEEKLIDDNASLKNDSMMDVMTQIYNRRYLNTFIASLSNGKIKTVGFAIFDVDYFKEYNDTYGHLSGDKVLIEIANILRNTDNNNIKPCRFGGDEFICIFIDMRDEEVEAYIKKVLKELNEKALPHESSKCSNHVTLSIGYGVSSVNKNLNIKDLLMEIDNVLYNSKRKGRNTYTKYVSEECNHE
ncbi:diguanylate cyclase [Anaerorhabdus sp.]|uniref:diguanylate cyclase n=1 Tax=Anaerorhabdus sp. TaxID=1872524 RepID=UPI002FC889A5